MHFWVFVVLLIFGSIANANDILRANVVLKERNILKWLGKVEEWEPQLVSYDYEPVSANNNQLIRVYIAERYCGSGACPHYLFLKLKNNQWRLIGILPSRFTIGTLKTNGYFDLLTSQKIPGMTDKSLEQKFIYDGQVYRPQ